MLTAVSERWLDVISTALLALATVATAWAAYQSRVWTGEQSQGYSHATATRIAVALGIAERFALIGGSDPAAGRVGKGPVIASVLTRLSLDPTRSPVVMVGDRSHDVEGAIANGVPAIGVGWGYADPGELADARLVVPDLDALFLALTDDDPVWCQRAQP